MSIRGKSRPLADDGVNRRLFKSPEPELRRLIWRNLQPVLLRSAGVAGLAAAIVAVIASAPLSERSRGEQVENAPLLSTHQPRMKEPSRGTAEPAPAAQRLAAFTAAEPDPAAPPSALLQAAMAQGSRTESAGDAPAPDGADPRLVQTRRGAGAIETPSGPATSAAEAAKDAIRTALASSDSNLPEGSVSAVDCTRDWLSAPGEGPADPSSACSVSAPRVAPAALGGPPRAVETATPAGEPAPAPRVAPGAEPAPPPAPVSDPVTPVAPAARLAALSAEETSLGNAPLNLAPASVPADSLPDDALAPVPRPRPEPPAAVKKPTRTRTAARGKLGPPPNCGKKYARWRYVNKQPTWYCK